MTAPIAFVVMPFETKRIDSTVAGVPGEVDFNALWTNVHEPVLAELGYRPVRADGDLGALIIKQMLQRLAVADLVVADISLPNANVYYEIGVRHAARQAGCVLVAADWAVPVFDLAQMRRIQYPLADGSCGPEAADRARAVLRTQLVALTEGPSPVFDAVPDFPRIGPSSVSAFEDLVDALSGFQADVAAIKEAASADARKALTAALLRRYGGLPAVRDTVAVQIVGLVRDHVGPEATLAYIEGLPRGLRNLPTVIEYQQVALAKKGDVASAAAQLRLLIEKAGPSSDRYGILGGRYKQLMLASEHGSRAYRRYLDDAIDAYERGMAEDLNDYYPSSNLPRLYRRRGGEGDAKKAVEVATIVLAACERASRRGDDPEGWVRLTQLGAAFDRGDGAEAARLADEVERSEPATFHLSSTMPDLELSYGLQTPAAQDELRGTLDLVRSLLDA